MKCYKCGKNTVYGRRSEYGFYYRCSNCGYSFETKSQSDNNRKHNPQRNDFLGNKQK